VYAYIPCKEVEVHLEDMQEFWLIVCHTLTVGKSPLIPIISAALSAGKNR
jgi:hypothetical protein